MRHRAALLLTVAGLIGSALPVSAQPRLGGTLNCSLSTLSAGTTYGYAISGFFDSTPIANYGFFTSNGAGQFSGSATVSVGGGIGSGNFAAAYTVNSNCTGGAVITNGLGQVFNLAFTINANGAVMDFVETDPDFTVAGSAAPLAPSCEVSAFSGPYTYSISGWLTATGANIPYADAGRVVADGNGNFTGKSTFATGVPAAATRRTLSGTYTVNAGCAGTVAVKDNLGNTGTLAMTLVNDGQQALFINTTPGTVVTGHLYRGQNTCSNSTVSGNYVTSVNGSAIAPDVFIPVAYSGMANANGSGSLTGADYLADADLNGAPVGNGVVLPRTYTASYTINSDCSGSEVVTDSLGETGDVDLYVADQGGIVEFIQTGANLVIAGQAQSVGSGTCSNATLNGAYGYAAEGWLLAPVLSASAGAGQIIADGKGNLTGAVTSAFDLGIFPADWVGTYQINPNCTGSMIVTYSGVTYHFAITVSPNGQFYYAIETDPDTVVASYAQYQVTQPTAAIVNLGSYTTNVAPGGLITIFGTGFTNGSTAQGTGGAPWPNQLDGVTVLVNNSPIPLYYVSATQIDAQLPVNLSTGIAQLVVQAGGQSTAAAPFTVSAAAPGILIYGPLRAVAQDANLNSILVGPSGNGTAPATPGDVLVVYVVDGGAVNVSSGTWSTGEPSPAGQSPVTAPYSVTIGGLTAKVDYYGLTQGFVGLYQLNVHVPSLPTGDHTLVITEDGVPSASALITVIN